MAKRKPSRKKRKVQRQRSAQAHRHSLPSGKLPRRPDLERTRPSVRKLESARAERDDDEAESDRAPAQSKARSGLGARIAALPLGVKASVALVAVILIVWGVLKARQSAVNGAESAEPPATEPIAGAPSAAASSAPPAATSAPSPTASAPSTAQVESSAAEAASALGIPAPVRPKPPEAVPPPRPSPTQPPSSLEGTRTAPAMPATSPPPATPLRHHPKPTLEKKVQAPVDNPY
jgi:hypothetical protein